MSEVKFDDLPIEQQQKIIELIKSDFRKAKLLYDYYQKQPVETENNS